MKGQAEETDTARPAYSIRVVAAETGIPADTLRMWERRYGFPSPARRPGGARLYAERDVARLRLIAKARDAGYRPGDVIALPDSEIVRLVERRAGPLEAPPRSALPDVDTLVEDVRNDEVARVRASLRSLAISLGPTAFVTDVAHPLAVRIGDGWATGALSVRHEHLATALISTQLRLLLIAFEEGESAPTVVLATLPGEAHALGLEMVAVYLAAQRATPRLLGADTPPDQIARAATALGARVVGVSVSGAHAPSKVRSQLAELRSALPARTVLWLGGAGAPDVAREDATLRIATRWADVDRALAAARG